MTTPTYNLSVSLGLTIQSQFQQIADNISNDNYILGGGSLFPFQLNLQNGSGASQASDCWHDRRTVANSTNDDIYLNGNAAFTNAFGQPLQLTNVKAIFLRMLTGGAGLFLTVGDHPNAPWEWDFTTLTPARKFADLIFPINRFDGWTVGGPVAAPTIPTMTASGSGGSIPSNTYYVVVTYLNPAGESVGGVHSAGTALTSPANLVVTSPGASGNATTYNVYVGTSTVGPFVLQGSPTAIGTPVTLSSLVNTGATPPLVNGAYQNSILRINNASGGSMQYDIALWGSP